MTAELPEVAQTTPASPFLFNPQEVWYISQVSYLLPRSSGRLLANQKLGQTFRAPGSWTSSPKPHAGSWPLYTLTVPFSGASWVSTLLPHLALVYSEARAPLPSELAPSPLVRFTTLQDCNWVLSQGLKHWKGVERGWEGCESMKGEANAFLTSPTLPHPTEIATTLKCWTHFSTVTGTWHSPHTCHGELQC